MRSARQNGTLRVALMGVLLTISGGMAGGLTGCAFHSDAAPDRAEGAIGSLLPADAWPARETELLQDMVAVTPQTLTLAFPMSIVVDGKLTTANWMTKVNVLSSGVYGRGLVRHFKPIFDDSETATNNKEMQEHEFGGLQFVSFMPDPNAVRVASTVRSEESPSRYRRFLLRRMSIRTGRDSAAYLMRAGTRMRMFPPEGSPRGVLLHLSSLAGFEYEKPVIDGLTNAGWFVLQIDPSTARRQERPVVVDPATDLTEPGERLAKIVDNRVAEIAYAAEAGLEYLHANFKELDGRPVVLAGFSAGALVGPSVAALLHDRVDAVVLVGGGANLLYISRRSSLTNGGINVRWVPAGKDEGEPAWDDDDNDRASARTADPAAYVPTDSDWSRLEQAYLAASRLDPYVTSPYLVDKPVLVLHGVFDDIVPAAAGELLYKRLGRPERLTFPLGHRGLFWRLPTQAGTIARWLERQTGEK